MAEQTEFSPQDRDRLAAHGIPLAEAARQLGYLRTPPPPIYLERPCSVGDGILQLEAHQFRELREAGEAAARTGRVTKFVPASGAATRMFKDLIAAQDRERPSTEPAAQELFERLDDFPFARELRQRSGVTGSPRAAAEEHALLDTLLTQMRYAQLPKALIPFHLADRPRTAFEEHLLEGTRFLRGADGACRMHFTVAPEFREEFEALLADLRPRVERQRPGTHLSVTFSEQHPATDTIALSTDGQPFRTSDGALLFRPGGHGALITNLNDLRGDIIVVKNIDNIVPDELSDEVVQWKLMLIGLLVRLQSEVSELLSACAEEAASAADLERALQFAESRFGRQPGARLQNVADQRRFVVDALDRPIRVCGVVRNEGEPGGAPFWVRGADGTSTVQIVESSQVNEADPAQARIFSAASHFNPVDIVCAVRSRMGEPHDLMRFVDPSAVFIARKTHEGQDLLALERPGLWNGGMAGWNTLCVEVPASTFAPVKTVFDLLRPQHRLGQPTERDS